MHSKQLKAAGKYIAGVRCRTNLMLQVHSHQTARPRTWQTPNLRPMRRAAANSRSCTTRSAWPALVLSKSLAHVVSLPRGTTSTLQASWSQACSAPSAPCHPYQLGAPFQSCAPDCPGLGRDKIAWAGERSCRQCKGELQMSGARDPVRCEGGQSEAKEATAAKATRV
jgi:hypothetical protein